MTTIDGCLILVSMSDDVFADFDAVHKKRATRDMASVAEKVAREHRNGILLRLLIDNIHNPSIWPTIIQCDRSCPYAFDSQTGCAVCLKHGRWHICDGESCPETTGESKDGHVTCKYTGFSRRLYVFASGKSTSDLTFDEEGLVHTGYRTAPKYEKKAVIDRHIQEASSMRDIESAEKQISARNRKKVHLEDDHTERIVPLNDGPVLLRELATPDTHLTIDAIRTNFLSSDHRAKTLEMYTREITKLVQSLRPALAGLQNIDTILNCIEEQANRIAVLVKYAKMPQFNGQDNAIAAKTICIAVLALTAPAPKYANGFSRVPRDTKEVVMKAAQELYFSAHRPCRTLTRVTRLLSFDILGSVAQQHGEALCKNVFILPSEYVV